jgi:ABC-type branched-subunit amino acid transport system substrate-binding protein
MSKKRFVIQAFIFFIFFFSKIDSYASDKNTLNIALLDTPFNEMPQDLSFWSQYQNAYFAGIEAAAYSAKPYGIKIHYKPFFYGSGPLDILDEIPKVKAWQPDVVIGPSFSDQFLLLKNYLNDVLVLSSYASDVALSKLPKNFYSLYLPDNYIAMASGEFIKEKYPDKNIYIISQADCKQCVDFGKLFTTAYKKLSPTATVEQTEFLQDDMSALDIKKLISGHENDVILAFPSTYFAYNTLINRITAQFPENNFIFFTDQDNWGSNTDVNTSGEKDIKYQSYRIAPLLFNSNSNEFKQFKHAYYQIYHSEPTDAVSYMTYVTVMSVVTAIKQFPTSANLSIHNKVLASYGAALAYDPNWFRSKTFGIYLTTAKGEVLVKTIPIENNN